MANTITLTATINLKTKEVHASKSALKRANLMPHAKDKGIKASYINKDGEKIEYLIYSVIDAVKLATEVKTTKKATKKATKATDEYSEIKGQINQLSEAVNALLQAQAK